MDILFTFLTSHPIGIGLLVFIIASIVGIIIFLISRGYEIIPDPITGKPSIVKKNKENKPSSEIKIKAPVKSKRIFEESLIYVVDKSFSELAIIKKKYREEMRRAQAEALEAALGTLSLNYSKMLKEDANISKCTRLIELYLSRDFNKIMSERLDSIRTAHSSGVTRKEELLDNLSKYSEEIIIKLLTSVSKCDLIEDQSQLTNLFENNKGTVKTTLETVIKQFISLDEKEQKEIIDIKNQIISRVTGELEDLLGDI